MYRLRGTGDVSIASARSLGVLGINRDATASRQRPVDVVCDRATSLTHFVGFLLMPSTPRDRTEATGTSPVAPGAAQRAGTLYDEVVERILLTNTFFNKFRNTLPLLECVTYRTARSVFYHLLTSAEA